MKTYIQKLRGNRLVVALLALLAFASVAQAQTDATAIVTAATTAFSLVAALCISIGTFFVVYRLAKRVK